MESIVKNKVGRPRKEPTYIKSIRLNKLLKDFYNSVENANNFIIQATINTPEFQAFLREQKEKDDAPRLF